MILAEIAIETRIPNDNLTLAEVPLRPIIADILPRPILAKIPARPDDKNWNSFKVDLKEELDQL